MAAMNASVAVLTSAVVITPGQVGKPEFYCAIGGHKEAGMDGAIDVS